jgi:hypothetical protein
VITVPHVWCEFDIALLRRAACKAGLTSVDHSDLLTVVAEPEAAAIGVHVDDPHSELLSAGNRFLVLNCSKRAIDIFAYEVVSVAPSQLRYVTSCGGADCGGDSVKSAFESFLRELLGAGFLPEYEGSHELCSVLHEFGKVLAAFDPSTQPGRIHLVDLLERKTQLQELALDWNARHPDKTVLVVPTLRNGFLTASKELMLSFLQPTLSCIVGATKAIMRDCPGARQIVTIGEFGCTPVVSNLLRAEFHLKQGVRVIVPNTSGSVAYGAVYYGLQWCSLQGTNYTVQVPSSPGTSEGTVQPAASTAISTTAEEGENDGANDPVYVPPAPGTSEGTVPPTASTAISTTAEEGEDDGANNFVYVPPAPGTSEGTVPPTASTAISTTAEEGENDGANNFVNVPPAPGTYQDTLPPAPTTVPTTAEEGEEEWANDPVYVPPAPSISQQGSLPPACAAISVIVEEREEEWANDPVYVPSVVPVEEG